MKKQIVCILILLMFTLSCSKGSEQEKGAELNGNKAVANELDADSGKNEKIIEDESALTNGCGCFDGIGSTKTDKPILVVDFSNGKSVSICGYKEEDTGDMTLLVSEFNVFECQTGESFAEYYATENCQIWVGEDTLGIKLLKYLPVGNNWEWHSIPIAEQLITAEIKGIKVAELSPKFELPVIDEILQENFLDSLRRGEGFGNNWEENIGKLEVLTLSGSKKAWGILKDYEEFTGEQTDGALAETWKDAIATVEWLLNK